MEIVVRLVIVRVPVVDEPVKSVSPAYVAVTV